ncbi:hypothetical protein AGR3A_Cc250003 [Agrobacterium tomkonis CFBP 6623]|uniref:Uncharacterized protein n=1 Tax=Agrobacterium tomkonis CFBP 6623 TaxID=1183432 RepID=A0A1S7PBG6_9HYPH|nr:hypothetical protein AGR3A_Cc250003 [Agrobacterium tomkonis CFBP 6623]
MKGRVQKEKCPLDAGIIISALGCAQFVDLGAEVLQHEVFFGGNLAFVDFLRPLLERNLDAEFLVDGENDIQKVEAVDAQIVDRVAFRRNGFAVDFAGFGDNVGNLVECSCHAHNPYCRSYELSCLTHHIGKSHKKANGFVT